MLNKINFKNNLLVFILLFFSGNELVPFLFGKFGIVIGLVLILIIFKSNLKFDTYFYKIITPFYFFLLFFKMTIFLNFKIPARDKEKNSMRK